MRLDRLLAIVVLLVNQRTVRAKDLAEMFEVSERTILRDISAINQAGIPVITYPGPRGGIGLSDNYRMEQSLLALDDIAAVLGALKGLQSAFNDDNLAHTIQKIESLIPQARSEEFAEQANRLVIDLTPWGDNEQLEGLVRPLRQAIAERQLIEFTYLTPGQEPTRRQVEPDHLLLKMNNWYLYGYCRLRREFRLFKLSRIRDIEVGADSFSRRLGIREVQSSANSVWGKTAPIEVVLRFVPEMRGLAEEYFVGGVHELMGDGSLVVTMTLPESDWLYGIILSYGAGVEVLAPEKLRQRLKQEIEQIVKKY